MHDLIHYLAAGVILLLTGLNIWSEKRRHRLQLDLNYERAECDRQARARERLRLAYEESQSQLKQEVLDNIASRRELREMHADDLELEHLLRDELRDENERLVAAWRQERRRVDAAHAREAGKDLEALRGLCQLQSKEKVELRRQVETAERMGQEWRRLASSRGDTLRAVNEATSIRQVRKIIQRSGT